ncbi:hypothetical protein IQ07DRAFT_23966 [Pyrenochaeta sp. DS3sAY3a]|nr:hypothetical protein IQ07DRAFT_23966 [Pyrenochaeta sp. DS3sAY3a]
MLRNREVVLYEIYNIPDTILTASRNEHSLCLSMSRTCKGRNSLKIGGYWHTILAWIHASNQSTIQDTIPSISFPHRPSHLNSAKKSSTSLTILPHSTPIPGPPSNSPPTQILSHRPSYILVLVIPADHQHPPPSVPKSLLLLSAPMRTECLEAVKRTWITPGSDFPGI